MSEPLVLAPRLDLPAASALKTMLVKQKADVVVLDFSEVKFIGVLCLQVILASAAHAMGEGRRVSLENLSERVTDQLRIMGVKPETIAGGVYDT